MDRMPTIAVLLLVALNLAASFSIVRNRLPLAPRLFQLALVWLLPVVGAVVCLAFAASERGRSSGGESAPFVEGADPAGAAMNTSFSSDTGGCPGSDGGCGDGGGGD